MKKTLAFASALALACTSARAGNLPSPNLGAATQINSVPILASGFFNPVLVPAFSGDCTATAGTTSLKCTKTNGVAFAPVATSGSAGDLGTGTLPVGRLPAFSGDCTTTAGTATVGCGPLRATSSVWAAQTFQPNIVINDPNGAGAAFGLDLAGVAKFNFSTGPTAVFQDTAGLPIYWRNSANGFATLMSLDGAGNLSPQALTPAHPVAVAFGGTGQTTAGLAALDAVAGATAPGANNYVLTNGTGTPTWFNLFGTPNIFTQPQTATQFIGTASVGGTGSAISAQSLAPAYSWKNTGGAGTDQNVWDLLVSGSTLLGRAISDNGAFATQWLEVDRSGFGISAIKMPTLTLTTPLGTASGGTGCATASFVCLDNIAGLSGASPTGILSRTGSGAYSFASLSAMLDSNFSSTQGFILYRGATGWTALPPGQSGYVLQSGGASANPSWVSPTTGGANRVLLNTLTASGSATLQDTTSLTSSYSEYDIVIEDLIPVTAGGNCQMQVQVGGAFKTSGYNSISGWHNAQGTGAGGSGSYIECSSQGDGINNIASGLSATFHLSNPSVSKVTGIYGTFFHMSNGSPINDVGKAGGQYSTAGAITGLKFIYSSGNWSSGVIKIYGSN